MFPQLRICSHLRLLVPYPIVETANGTWVL